VTILPVHLVRNSPGVVAAVALAVLCSPGPAAAQAAAPANPHAAQPERPTVATHAYTVAPGWIEIEAGAQRQKEGALADRLAVPVVVKIGLGERLQLGLAPGWQREAEGGGAEAGITDLLVAVKWRLTEDAPVVGAFAVQPAVSFPTGSADSGRGSGKAAFNVLMISSHRFGPLSLDVNAGYTRLGGESASAPRDSTVWAVAAALPIAGRVGWAAEIYGYPGTSGPNGSPPVVAVLTGPNLAVGPSLVVDAGAIFDVVRFGGTSVYAGLTWNIGRIWRSSSRPSRHLRGRD
jgi:hypothetical protein